MTGGKREMLAWAAAGLGVLGLVFIPPVAVIPLSVYGLVTLARYVPVAAVTIGCRALASRVAIGASFGPWLALAAPELGRFDALQAAAAGAVLAVLSVEIRRSRGTVKLIRIR